MPETEAPAVRQPTMQWRAGLQAAVRLSAGLPLGLSAALPLGLSTAPPLGLSTDPPLALAEESLDVS